MMTSILTPSSIKQTIVIHVPSGRALNNPSPLQRPLSNETARFINIPSNATLINERSGSFSIFGHQTNSGDFIGEFRARVFDTSYFEEESLSIGDGYQVDHFLQGTNIDGGELFLRERRFFEGTCHSIHVYFLHLDKSCAFKTESPEHSHTPSCTIVESPVDSNAISVSSVLGDWQCTIRSKQTLYFDRSLS